MAYDYFMAQQVVLSRQSPVAALQGHEAGPRYSRGCHLPAPCLESVWCEGYMSYVASEDADR